MLRGKRRIGASTSIAAGRIRGIGWSGPWLARSLLTLVAGLNVELGA